MTELKVLLGESEPALAASLQLLIDASFASRLFAEDASLWGESASPEAAVRLGWTDFERAALELIPQVDSLRARFEAQGVDRYVLCGMGGSSLAPGVITRWAGRTLEVLDSTHPATVRSALSGDLTRTAVVVSSKSGTTIETMSQLAAFEEAFRLRGIDPASRIVIVTDPDSPLDLESRAASRTVFNADPHVGGRFSALTAFGLVPAGLAGADVHTIVSDAQAARSTLMVDSAENPALRLAAAIAAGLPKKYVLAVRSATRIDWGLGAWIEQLIAESTGKDGRGVLPIALAGGASEFSATPDSVRVVELREASAPLADTSPPSTAAFTVEGSLGAQFLLWESVTAALGALLGIDPFNQPDVESAKSAARQALSTSEPAADSDDSQFSPAHLVQALRGTLRQDGYLAIQAYLDPGAKYAPELTLLRDALARLFGLPVSLGWGPSYLHSTGQLHKGGPPNGTFLQLVDARMEALAIPGSETGFDRLITAQARGDRDVLRARGREVHLLEMSDPEAQLAAIIAEIETMNA